jgi:hypothetical protein
LRTSEISQCTLDDGRCGVAVPGCTAECFEEPIISANFVWVAQTLLSSKAFDHDEISVVDDKARKWHHWDIYIKGNDAQFKGW